MATNDTTTILKNLRDLTDCSLCLDTCEDPRQLPCIHSFCLKCLLRYCEDKAPTTEMACPLCRKETKIPAEGVRGFQRNFFLEKLIEVVKVSHPKGKDSLCDVCQEDEQLLAEASAIPLASMHCTYCRQNMCERCVKEHKRQRMTKTHAFVEIGNEQIGNRLAKEFQKSFCSKHEGKTVEMFCVDCEVVICLSCFTDEHQRHKFADINKTAEDFRKQIEADFERVLKCLSFCKKRKETNEECKMIFLKAVDNAQNDIGRKYEELKHMISCHANLLHGELESLKRNGMKEILVETEETDRHLAVIESFTSYMRNMLAVGSASDICHSVHQFHDRLKEFEKFIEDAASQEPISRRILFTSTELPDEGKKNLLGKLEALNLLPQSTEFEQKTQKFLPVPTQLSGNTSTQKTMRCEVCHKGTGLVNKVTVVVNESCFHNNGINDLEERLNKILRKLRCEKHWIRRVESGKRLEGCHYGIEATKKELQAILQRNRKEVGRSEEDSHEDAKKTLLQ